MLSTCRWGPTLAKRVLFTSSSVMAICLTTSAYSADVTISSGTTVVAQIIADGSSLTVENGAEIDGVGDAVLDAGLLSSLTNYGKIIGTLDGVDATNIGTIVNSGTITGTGDDGIYSASNLSSLVNSGTITGGTIGGVFVDGTIGNAVNSGTITGFQVGIFSGEIVSLINTGTITGTNDDGIYAGCGCGITYLNNSGTIKGGDDGIDAIVLTSLINSGTIEGAADGVFIDTLGSLVNSGTIEGGVDGVYANTSIGSIINSGTITGVSDGIQTDSFGSLTSLVNSGLIKGGDEGVDVDILGTITNTGMIMGGTGKGIDANFGTIINSGTITGNVGIEFDRTTAGDATVTNSGIISSTLGASGMAIDFQGIGSDTLNIQLNSILIGKVEWDGLSDTLNIAPETSATVTFSTLPDNINMSSEITRITGTTVTQVDTTFLGVIDDVFTNSFSNVSSGIFDRLNGLSSGRNSNSFSYGSLASAGERTSWASGWAGVGAPDNTSSATTAVGGVSLGADIAAENGDLYGVLLGSGIGHTKIGEDLGHDIRNLVYYGGIYGRLHRDNYVADFNLQGGYLSFDSDRHIANNNLASGRETASAEYSGYYIAPAVKFSKRIDRETGYFLNPSLAFGYSAIHIDGYSETGSTSDISVGSRLIHNLTAKTEIAYGRNAINKNGTNYQVQSYAGIEGIYSFGDATTATATLSNVTKTFNPGGSQSSVKGFAGFRLNVDVSPNTAFNSGVEFSYNNHGKVAASTNVNFSIKF